jgi:hypothetical protein
MKLISTEVTNWAIPGTVREIMVLIVRKEKSSNMFQMYWINKEKRKLVTIEFEISRLPSLKVDANA